VRDERDETRHLAPLHVPGHAVVKCCLRHPDPP